MKPTSITDLFEIFKFPEEANCPPSDPILREAMVKVFKKSFWGDQQLTAENLHIDHLIPQALGGPNNIFNYVASVARPNLVRQHRVSVVKLAAVLYLVETALAPRVMEIVRRKRAAIKREKVRKAEKSLRLKKDAAHERRAAARDGLTIKKKRQWDPRDDIQSYPHLMWTAEPKLREFIAKLLRIRDCGRLGIEGDTLTIRASVDELVRWDVVKPGSGGAIRMRHNFEMPVIHEFGTRGNLIRKKHKGVKAAISLLGPDRHGHCSLTVRMLRAFVDGWFRLGAPSAASVLEEYEYGLMGECLDEVDLAWPSSRRLLDECCISDRKARHVSTDKSLRGLAHIHFVPSPCERALIAALMDIKARGYLGVWGNHVWGHCLNGDTERLGFDVVFQALTELGRNFYTAEYATKSQAHTLGDGELFCSWMISPQEEHPVFAVQVPDELIKRWFSGRTNKAEVLAEYDTGLLLAEDVRGLYLFDHWRICRDRVVGEQYLLEGGCAHIVTEEKPVNWEERPWKRLRGTTTDPFFDAL